MGNNIIEAEFKVVQERTLDIIITEIRTIDNHVCQVALNGAIEIGQKLEEAKEKVGHGNWENWCKENLSYSKSQAERFMKISTEYGSENSTYLTAISKTSTLTDFSISKALALLQVPENEVENFIENSDIPEMTVKEIEAEAKRLKVEKEELEKKISEMLVEADLKKKELEENLEAVKAEKDETYKSLQNLQEKTLKANNGELSPEAQAELDKKQAEIDKLQKDIEKKQKAEATLKDKIAKADEEKQKAVEEATIKAKEDAQKLAEDSVADTIVRIISEKESALERVAAVEKQLAIMDKEGAAERKVKMQFINTTVNDIVAGIENIENADKAKDSLRNFLVALSNTF